MVVQFVVEKDGRITEVKVVRDSGYGLEQAAAEVVESMNFMPEKWTPGTQIGKAVRYYIPYRSILNCDKSVLIIPHIKKFVHHPPSIGRCGGSRSVFAFTSPLARMIG